MSVDPLLALRGAACDLLARRGRGPLALLLERGTLELGPEREGWQLGLRRVRTLALGLALDAPDFAALTAALEDQEALRAAIADAARGLDVELASLTPLLRLPMERRPWATAYRGALSHPARVAPSTAQVLEAAAALADALGEPEAARALGEAELEVAPVASTDVPLVRHALRLTAPALARAERDAAFAGVLRRCVELASSRLDQRVADVALRLRVPAGG